jgi:hypothetical protein
MNAAVCITFVLFRLREWLAFLDFSTHGTPVASPHPRYF